VIFTTTPPRRTTRAHLTTLCAALIALTTGCLAGDTEPASSPAATPPSDARPSLAAPNPLAARAATKGLDATLARDGLAVRLDGLPSPLRIAAHALGRTDAVTTTLPTATSTVRDGGRSARDFGAMSEWYREVPRGIEQGFDVRTRPPGAFGPLAIDVTVEGAGVVARADGTLGLRVASGHVVATLSELWARDAQGRALTATMRPHGDGYRIEVDDRDATYPLVVDPLLVATRDEVAPTIAGGDWPWLGRTLDAAGDMAVVAAPRQDTTRGTDAGGAWLLTRDAGGGVVGRSAVRAGGAVFHERGLVGRDERRLRRPRFPLRR